MPRFLRSTPCTRRNATSFEISMTSPRLRAANLEPMFAKYMAFRAASFSFSFCDFDFPPFSSFSFAFDSRARISRARTYARPPVLRIPIKASQNNLLFSGFGTPRSMGPGDIPVSIMNELSISDRCSATERAANFLISGLAPAATRAAAGADLPADAIYNTGVPNKKIIKRMSRSDVIYLKVLEILQR